MANFTKAEAIVAKAANGTDSILLKDTQINELLNLNGAAADPLQVYGSDIPAALPSFTGQGASLTYYKNVLSPAIIGSAVYDDSGNIAKANPVTIYLNSHLGYQEELTVAEANSQGLGTWAATKLSNYAVQALKTKTRAGFIALAAGAPSLDIAAKATGENERDYAIRILKELAETAGMMAKTSDPEQGIDTFTTDQITITVGPKIQAAVMAAGLQGGMTAETFANGVVQKTQWANIKIQFSAFLDGVDAFIGTSFLGKSPMATTSMYAGPKSNVGLKYKSSSSFLLPGADATAATTGFEFIFNDKIADTTKVDYTSDFVTRMAVNLA